jgi:glycosyltransferase involved in cell wall biosynthesis
MPTNPTPEHEPPRVAALPWMVAGVQTQYENLRSTSCWQECVTDVVPIEPYREGGAIERLPLLRDTQKGTLRSAWQASRLLQAPGYDAILSQVALPLIPLLAACSARVRPLPAITYTIDTTPALMDRFHLIYYGTPSPGPRKRAARDRLHRYVFRHCAAIAPWSHWAAKSFVQDYGVLEERIHVTSPGVNLRQWTLPSQRAADADTDGDQPFRLLFVGADFERKGGELLLDVFRRHFVDTCELHLVTRAEVPVAPEVHIYPEFASNDQGLRDLYTSCDAFVLPTRADCFSIASIEAMACGLPVISCPVGGIPEIVQDGVTGFLVPSEDGRALADAIRPLSTDRKRSLAMGLSGRQVVEARFDAERNATALFALIRSATNQPDH